MRRHLPRLLLCASMLCAISAVGAEPFYESAGRLADTAALAPADDRDVRIVDQAHALLDRLLAASPAGRSEFWQRDPTNREAYDQSVSANRERLCEIVGVVDQRCPASMERFGDDRRPALVAEGAGYRVYQVRWPVLDGVWGEGLLLEPTPDAIGVSPVPDGPRPNTLAAGEGATGRPRAQIVALPDADHTAEQLAGLAPGIDDQSQFARRLAEAGCRVVIPQLVNRECTFSGNPRIKLYTNQPHREWIYRQAYEMGRHVIGYEVQKVLAAVDWFTQSQQRDEEAATTDGPGRSIPIGVAGYGEGGLVAMMAAAVDPRIDACLVTGYFDNRRTVWREPIYRNAWRLLREFGDAEIATLIAPRALIVEHSPVPRVDGPPPVPEGRRGGAAPGRLETPPAERVAAEFARVDTLIPADFGRRELIAGADGATVPFGSADACRALATSLGVDCELPLSEQKPHRTGPHQFDPERRQQRQIDQIVNHVQWLLRRSPRAREQFFLDQVDLESADGFAADADAYRERFRHDVIGWLDGELADPAARSRLMHDEPTWRGYEVVLDVLPGLDAWGILCVPKDLKPGERRPVVVCQHGLEGIPMDTITTGDMSRYYASFAAKLADRGFITFAPFNLYRGKDRFRMLQRKANPLGLSLFSLITRQHEQILRWLGGLEYVDPRRIAFYGLSYGGKTAMRVPAQLEGYCLSICSGDFNEWIYKNVTLQFPASYMYTGEWEIYEFNLGHTFNYAEMAYLIFPRPFMVERGHYDGVGQDHWVAHEYAKIRYLYNHLERDKRTEIEFFAGPHCINGEGTYDFLHRHLDWPRR